MSILSVSLFTSQATAQTLDLSKLKQTSDVPPVKFTQLDFEDNVAEVTFDLVSSSTVYSFDVEDPTYLYNITATAHKPIGIVLNANLIELNNKNQATSRTQLMSDHARGTGDQIARLPQTLFKPGRIYLGLAPLNPVEVTLRVERVPPVETPKTFSDSKKSPTSTENDIAFTGPGDTISCVSPALLASGKEVDLALITGPKSKVEVNIYNAEGKRVAYKAAHEVTGLHLPDGRLCIETPRSGLPVSWRLLTTPSEFTDIPWEPNNNLEDASGPKLTIADPFVMPLDSSDTDWFSLAHLSGQGPLSVQVKSGVRTEICLYHAKEASECFEGRDVTISPFEVMDNTSLSVENETRKRSLYELTLNSVQADPSKTLFEPNRKADYQPLLDGAFRIEGELNGGDDTDTIGFDAGVSSQMWRFRILGESVEDVYVSNPRRNIASFSRNRHGRNLILPDLYLEPGSTYIRLSGNGGDYKVIAKPLGPPRADSEREPNGNNPRRVLFGEPITGTLTADDAERFSFYLPRDSALNLFVDVPAGAVYERAVYQGPRYTQSSPDLEKEDIGAGEDVHRINVPAGEHVIALSPEVGSPAEYKLSVDYANPFQSDGSPSLDITLKDIPDIAAFSLFHQRITVMMEVTNTSSKSVKGETMTWFARPGVFNALQSTVSLKPGQSVSIPVSFILPDDIYKGNLPFFAAVQSEQGKILGSARGTLKATAKAPVVGLLPAHHVPPALLGGINVGHSGLGAKWIEADGVKIDKSGDYERHNPAGAGDLPSIIDGYIAKGQEGYLSSNGRKPILAPVLDLPGKDPIPIAGVGINTRMSKPYRLRGFAIDVSTDSKTWQEVLNTSHETWGETSYYPFPGGAVEATQIRLRATEHRDGESTPVALNAFEVIAAPGRSGLKNLNISTVKLGALVTGQTNMRPQRHLQIDEDNQKISKLSGREDNPTEFNNAISFRNQLEAEIEAVELTYPEDFSKADVEDKWARTALVFASQQGSTGPFRKIGQIDLPENPTPGQVVRLDLPEWTPAKTVKIEYGHGGEYYFHPPLGVRIIERPESADYKSVLGTWGELATSRSVPGETEKSFISTETQNPFLSFLEKRGLAPSQIFDESAKLGSGSNSAGEKAVALPIGTEFETGQVEFEAKTDIWRIKADKETNTIKVVARGSAGFDPTISARNSDGKSIDPLEVSRSGFSSDVTYAFPVEPDDYLDVTVSESQRSTVFVFDQSGSMGSYIPKIRRAIIDFADDMVVGRDAIQFKSVGGNWGGEEWFSDPEILRPTIANYKGHDGSGSEGALIDAAKLLSEREGSRAIVIITDAETPVGRGLMHDLHESRARVFVVKTPSDDPRGPQTKTLLWAGQTGGEVSFVSQSEDVSVAYARASARLLGPKPYSIRAEAETRVLKPGFLTVSRPVEGSEEGESTPSLRQLIILDASGSMLKRLEEGRRINIAKTALNTFLSNQKTRAEEGGDIQIGLRVFGGEPQSCDTELVKPVSKFDYDALKPAIDGVRPQNNAKTAIGAALTAAAKDLEDVADPASVLLITDGEETCGGDPLKAISDLRDKGIKSRIDVVSFALEPEVDRRPFESWAKAGGGIFVDAETGDDLSEALARATQLRFSVFQDDKLIASGASGDEKIELESGQYDLKIEGQEPQSLTINPSKTTRVSIK